MRKIFIYIFVFSYIACGYAAPVNVGLLKNVSKTLSSSGGGDSCGIGNILNDIKNTANNEIQKNIKIVKDETSKKINDMSDNLSKNTIEQIEKIKAKIDSEIIDKSKNLVDKIEKQVDSALSYITYLKIIIIVVCIVLFLFIAVLFISIFRIKKLLSVNKELVSAVGELERKIDLLFRK
ncbi:MAG: hypothetical protein LBC92_05490 [Rickettsiales bacterium]|jgi:hypothetical protein|nr:hypothetical protein [Rickettsiales bacterium]